MPQIAIVFNERSAEASELTARLCGHLTAKGYDARGVESVVEHLERVDLVVVMGGDGTFLRAARLVARQETPLLGVDLGKLGFLSEVGVTDIPGAIDNFFAGKTHLEPRSMIAVRHIRLGSLHHEGIALNEAVASKGASGRLLEFAVFADDHKVASYAADGVLLATPTGSTAYALAAGGPILAPDLEAWIVTPICPHALTARPLVIPDRCRVRIIVTGSADGAVLTVDGVHAGGLSPGDEIEFRKSSHRTHLVRTNGFHFYERLREKLRWGERHRRVKDEEIGWS